MMREEGCPGCGLLRDLSAGTCSWRLATLGSQPCEWTIVLRSSLYLMRAFMYIAIKWTTFQLRHIDAFTVYWAFLG